MVTFVTLTLFSPVVFYDHEERPKRRAGNETGSATVFIKRRRYE
jgi:hypothetical protein